jgi:hypothetical protein
MKDDEGNDMTPKEPKAAPAPRRKRAKVYKVIR